MLQSRAKKLDRNSLKYLYKVCNSSRSSLLDSVKAFCFVRNFSNLNALPTDERFDFQNSREFSGENDLNRANNGEVSSGYGKDWSFRGSNGGLGGNSNVVYRENSMGAWQNTSGGYWQTPNFSNNSGGSLNEVYSENYLGVEQNSSGGYWQNPNPSNMNNSGENPNGVYRGYSMDVQKNTSGGYWQSPSFSNNYGGSQNEIYRENSMGKDQNPSGGYLQNHNGIYRESSMGVQKNPSGHYWQSENGIYRESSMGVQQNPSGGYWQSPNFSNNLGGSYNQTPIPYNGMGNSQISSYTQPAEDTVDAGEDGQLQGTIEELDFFCKEQKLKEAVEVLGLLEQHEISVDIPRYVLLMKECGESKALEEAKYVHEHLLRSVSHLDVSICNKILEMYSKCGSMDDAYLVFHRMAQRNLTSWDTMITWLAKNGRGEDAIDMFTEFKKIGLKPDSLMFFGVFKACSVLGDMKEGLLHFESMSKNYGIVPSIGHYVSVVEMLGSAGYLNEALEFIEKMPMEPGVDIWEIMMNQCRIHGDTELGDHCAEFVEQLDPSRLDEQSKAGLISVNASDITREKEQKRSSFNPLEIKTKIYEYRAGDTSHPEHEKLYALLRCLKQAMKEAGYVPETKFVLHDIDQESKEEALLSHSERLALAQALMTSSARSQIRIMKNLRVCGDCHNALKIISKLVGRRIVARDAKRFHHFENGVCSCGDYW